MEAEQEGHRHSCSGVSDEENNWKQTQRIGKTEVYHGKELALLRAGWPGTLVLGLRPRSDRA